MNLDCAIIGGGPAGLNAALVLGRSRRVVIVFDHNKPRNAVTHESHGFITRDGIEPRELRRLAHADIAQYPSVTIKPDKVTEVQRSEMGFHLMTSNGVIYHARTLILAAGLKESLPAIPGIRDFYGRSLFSCPYCDGWELRDQPLVVISEGSNIFNLAKTVFNWSRNVVVCTNGMNSLSSQQIGQLGQRGIQVTQQKIKALHGENGRLHRIVFANNTEIERTGGFVTPSWGQAAHFGEALGCAMTQAGGFVTDDYGRTSIRGIYAAGDSSIIVPAQLVVAAGEGSKAAIGVNTDLSHQDFGF
ncbi:pyridine nucleotide-disulfide oxidoreductase [Paenibacillus sp. FSL A5-0031]|uniref:NAD(P)/FAD-dependent oxidoreductase n=1 Tax=Paenibacillus sp. FSL A5-0031 TaxID=1920420 RepID=UPI00096D791F|nr:NAD(P)/FAD-dependent oxidoreductase [Paenibacillus sp. FSL A5-0031]OME87350.1 pyridine nucleotide-disulfide oxidoreductase [Paenibacillus sp. FSL A5-0031]